MPSPRSSEQYGKGSVMRLGDDARAPMEVIPTGSIALDIALGSAGSRAAGWSRSTDRSPPARPRWRCTRWPTRRAAGGIAAFIDAEHALDPDYAKTLGVDTDALLVSQPDTGEQALEIADMLVRSGALDIIVIDSVAALVPRAEIEGEMGDSHVGLQARLMSQALRKMTGALSNSTTTAIFINQLREKIGVMFGCFSLRHPGDAGRRHQEKIGKIVNQKLAVEVLSYDPDADQIVPRKVVNWFDNGADRAVPPVHRGEVGRQRSVAVRRHREPPDPYPGGWREAGELIAGDRVMASETHRLSDSSGRWSSVR